MYFALPSFPLYRGYPSQVAYAVPFDGSVYPYVCVALSVTIVDVDMISAWDVSQLADAEDHETHDDEHAEAQARSLQV